jgi:transcriptional regulator with XRE-family HTH domain
MCNELTKRAIREAGIYQYQVAAKLGVSEMTLIRWLRTELPEKKRKAIIEAVEEVKNEVGDGCEH